MSVREEDKQRNCPSRGLGIAAAAIGVGVGAALYYFFNKRNQNPDASGSTSNWTSEEEAQVLQDSFTEESNTSSPETTYSVSDSDVDCDLEESHVTTTETSGSEYDMSMMNTELNTSDASYTTISEHSTTDTSINSFSTDTQNISIIEEWNDHNLSDDSIDVTSQDLSMGDYWVWESSMMPGYELVIPPVDGVVNILERMSYPPSPVSRHTTADIKRIETMGKLREQAFRERTWTLEECSICFESMQREQEIMALPCTHRFHQPCILPWLQERQTCPNCRKIA